MIQSLLIANRGEIVWPFIRTAQFLPGTGRGTAQRWRGRVGQRHSVNGYVLALTGPFVSPLDCHLPVPGRNL
jgi:hypothetical protein